MGSDKVEQLVVSMGDRLTKYLDTAESLVIENAPALVQEIYSYYLTIGWIFFITGAIFTIGIIAGYITINVKGMSVGEEWLVSGLVAFVLLIAPIFTLIFNLITILKINLAPKLFLIQKIMEIL